MVLKCRLLRTNGQYLSDPSAHGLLKITVPGAHALDPGFVIRQVVSVHQRAGNWKQSGSHLELLGGSIFRSPNARYVGGGARELQGAWKKVSIEKVVHEYLGFAEKSCGGLPMRERVILAKLVSAMLGAALSAVLLVGLPLGIPSGTVVEGLIFTSIVALVATVSGGLLGLPAILIVDKLFPDSKLRHIIVAPFCSVFAWLVIEGAFSREGWHRIWASGSFWIDWAPRRVAIAILIGLLTGAIYTIIWPQVRRAFRVNE